MTTRFFTNSDGNTLLQKFAAVFSNNPQIAEFDALVAYFRSTGYFRLRPHLEKLEQIRILVGIDVDHWTSMAQQSGLSLQFGVNEEQAAEDYTERFKKEIADAEYDQQTENSILQFVDDIQSGKVLIRAHPSRKLHAKIYIFRPRDFNEHKSGEVITGSSNLTEAGLGVDDRPVNYEFNVSLRDYDDIKFASDEFEKLWAEAVEVLPEQVTRAKYETHLRDDFTPFEIYIKLLIEYFGKEIEFDPNSVTDLPKGWLRLNYQMDAVEQGFLLLEKHNGFFLSDVVGLGKTVIATLAARKYFYLNDYPEYRSWTLIVCPPAVRNNWEETTDKFGLDNVEIITSGSLHKITKAKKYDLVIVDEAHKFRNDASQGYSELQRICKFPCRREGDTKRVILVSATPLNNRPDDIRNQLLLFQDANDSTLDINISRFFITAANEYREIMQNTNPGKASHQRMEDLYARIRDKVIEPLTVRRTRTDLKQHPVYANDLEQQGITFPKTLPPENLLYQLPPDINACYEHSFNLIQNKDGNGLQYGRYRLLEYLKPEHKKDYQQPDFIVMQLTAIMRTLLVKRLDSSFYSFHQSLVRFVQASADMLKMVNNNRIYIAPDQDIGKYLENNEDELIEKLLAEQQTDPRIKILTRDDFEPELFDLLAHDHKLLMAMEHEWREITAQHPDPKLKLLLTELPKKLLHTRRNPERKLVIFSESKDTTDYLTKKLNEQGHRVLAISSENREKQRETIKENFDANIQLAAQKSDYDILVSTESLAEGVNLHHANSIVNYDTPWNSTRLMQRIGRINRIGSKANTIHIYNFFPTEQVEDDIRLRHRAQMKLQAFHSALGEDSQIYSPDEAVESFGLFDKTVGEDKTVSKRLSYLMEIRKFREDNPDEFKRIKDLPLKIRNAVEDADYKGDTLCFLRNGHHAFYRIGGDKEVEELGFLEAAPIFKSHRNHEQAQFPSGTHYPQIKIALTHYVEQAREKTITEKHAPEITTQQRKAINYLNAFLNTEIANEQEKQRIKQSVEWIIRGRYQNLPRDINKLQQSQKKSPVTLAKQLEALLVILDKHAPHYEALAGSGETRTIKQKVKPPKVVISQSYV